MLLEKIKLVRKAALAVLLIVFFAMYFYICAEEKKECLGVDILTDTTEYSQYQYQDFAPYITHYGKKAAVDTTTNTIYISQPIDKDTGYMDFAGALELNHAGYTMYFAPDSAFEDIPAATAAGHPFRLIITDGSGEYMEYSVIFTSLPVIAIEGESAYFRDPEQEGADPTEIFAGDITVWTPFDPQIKTYSAKSSRLEWHVRGNSAAVHAKKPWKLALKEANGENADLDLFGLGADDDWILNALAYDHTRVREKLFMGLWNDMAQTTDYNTQMTDGQYVEVVMNGNYHGLYIMQRRIDGKLLNLTEHDILLKGKRTYETQYVYHAYKIIHTNLEEGYVNLLMENIWNQTDMSSFNLDNFIDTNLFIQFAYARDNRLYNNTFFTLKASPEGYKTTMTMWDTDISFGKFGVMNIDYDRAVSQPMEREDTHAMRAIHPDYDIKSYERWQQLRADILSEENIYGKIDSLMAEITRTNSLARDYARWGITESDPDSLELVEKFISERLPILDDYFAEQANNG